MVHAAGVRKNGLFLGKTQTTSKELFALEDTGGCPMGDKR